MKSADEAMDRKKVSPPLSKYSLGLYLLPQELELEMEELARLEEGLSLMSPVCVGPDILGASHSF